MSKRLRIRSLAIWLLIAALAGGAGHFIFDANFWLGASLALLSVLVNGLVIEWEDRQPGGWSE